MDLIIETFHVDIKLLIAQAINFVIVFLVLYFFILKPLIKVMQSRSEKIEKGLADARKFEEKLAQAEMVYADRIKAAKKEAMGIIEQSKKDNEKRREEMILKTKKQIAEIVAEEKTNMREEKSKIVKEIKSELADLIVLGIEKVLDKKIVQPNEYEEIRKITKSD